MGVGHPALPISGLNTLGACSVFERGVHIVGVQAEVRGISQTGGLKKFSFGLAEHLAAALN